MIAEPKFTLPLLNYIIKDLQLSNHRFLIVNQDDCCQIEHKNVVLLTHPLRFRLISNFIKFYKEIISADKIIAHAAPMSFFFIFIPWKLKHVIWVIHGGVDIPLSRGFKNLYQFINFIFKKNVGYHLSHIEEDSKYVNNLISSNAKFLYSPTYLSNVIKQLKDENQFLRRESFVERIVLVGNSSDPSNNHKEAFEKLLNSQLIPNSVVSILSYGIYDEYRVETIKLGYELFGKKFTPITDFMTIDTYLKLLDKVNLVVFNHKRQEAMGVTIQLLSLAKPIFFNPESPAYKSFTKRGYKVFSIDNLSDFRNIECVDLSINRQLLLNEYSIEVLNTFYRSL